VSLLVPQRPKVVFLDRIAIRAQLRKLRFDHDWFEYPTTYPEDLVARLHGASIAITNRARFGDEELSQLPELRLIAVSATGYDSIDIEACRRRGVTVTNIRDWSTTAVAEHVFSLILALRRQLFLYRPLIEAGAWQESQFYGLLKDPLPGDLYGSTIGIVGNGHLGQRVAALGAAFEMRPVMAEHKGRPPRQGRVRFEEVLQQCDVLCIACPLTEETRGMIGAVELAQMKPGALLINCARGGIVDDAALAEALTSGRLAGAGVDVLGQEPPRGGNPLLDLKLPNLIVTPHMAFASERSIRNLAEQLMTNIEAFVSGQPRNVVA
jgi:glycerate dehydrogenase